jgi:uridylate kinase
MAEEPLKYPSFTLGERAVFLFSDILQTMYKRILLKLSGEQLQGKFDGGFDAERAVWIANEIKKIKNTEVVIMIGGGNYVRGAQLAGGGVERITADNMGMLGTLMNAIALTDVFNSVGVSARALTNIQTDQIADRFTHRRAFNHLQKGRVIIVGGGIGQPYLTTDTAAVTLALQLSCDGILKATKVDGVYDKDPVSDASAKKYESLTLKEAVAHSEINVMDRAAIALAYDHSLPLVVFELLRSDNVARAAAGEKVGTTIKP